MLDDQKCLVTGASSGIGLATCRTLTKYNATVIGTGRSESILIQQKKEGHIFDYVVADLSEMNQCEHVIKKAVHLLGGHLTSLINCAGVLKGGGMGDPKVDLSNYEANMAINTQAPFELMVHSIPYLKKETSSSIVNVSSVNGKQSFPGCVTYCMSKAALDQLTRCASVDLAKDGVRVNSVNPGVIATNLQKAGGLTNKEYEQFLERSINHTHPLSKSLKRVGQADEVGELISFLVSNKARFITGECIGIDGGRQNLGAR